MKDSSGDDGERDLKLVGEHAHESHHDKRKCQSGGPRDVAESLTELTFRTHRWHTRIQGRAIHGHQGADDRNKADGVHGETPAFSDGRDEDTGRRRSHGASHVVHRGVQADGISKVVGPDHLEDESLTGWVFKAVVESEHHREEADV